MRKTIVLILLSLITVPFMFANEAEDSEWFIGKPIRSFVYSGLKSIKAEDIDNVLDKYIGEEFTYEILGEIQDTLYSEIKDGFDELSPSADKDANGDLILLFDFVEKPRVESIKFEGNKSFSDRKLRGTLSVQEGNAFYINETKQGEAEIAKLYKGDGFREVEVTSSYTQNEETKAASIVYTIDEGYKTRLSEFAFIGNYSFNDSELINAMKKAEDTLKVSGYFEDGKVKNNVEAIKKLYEENGFIDAVISDMPIEDISENVEQKGYMFRLPIRIVEGQQWKLGSVVFIGVEKLNENDLKKHISMSFGDVLNRNKLNEDIDKISGDYYDNGYIYSNFDTSFKRNENDGTIDVILKVTEGVQSVVEDIKLSGNNKTKDYVFLREITMKKGEVFSRQKLIKSMQNIYNTTLISDINYSLSPGKEEGSVVVTFIVTEAKQMDLTLGITFGGNTTGFPLSLLASVSEKNLVGKGMKLTAGVQLNTDYQAVTFSWNDSWVGDKRWANGVSFQFERAYKKDILKRNPSPNSDFLYGRNEAFPAGYSSYEDWMAHKESLPGSKYLMSYTMYRFSLGYNTGYTWSFDPGRLTLSGSLSFGLNRVYYDENSGIPYEYLVYKYHQAWQWSNMLSVSIQWDGRDFVQNTTNGYLLSQSFTYAGGVLGGLSNYIRSNTSVSGYVSLFKIGNGIKPRALVLSLTSNLGLMLPQWWGCDVDTGRTQGWQWHDPKYGATKNEMLYIDGMLVSRGTDSVYDLSFLWDTIVELSFPIAVDIINFEVFTSITAGAKELAFNKPLSVTWYGALGLGVRLKISGFPLGLYFVGNYSYTDGMAGVEWKTGGIFNYVRPVLSISTSLF